MKLFSRKRVPWLDDMKSVKYLQSDLINFFQLHKNICIIIFSRSGIKGHLVFGLSVTVAKTITFAVIF